MVAKESQKPAEAKKTAKPAKADAKSKTKTAKKVVVPKFLLVLFAPVRSAGRYVKGSWKELRQVFWPTRRATWGLTLAVILFTVFFAIVIMALDTGFQELFKRILL